MSASSREVIAEGRCNLEGIMGRRRSSRKAEGWVHLYEGGRYQKDGKPRNCYFGLYEDTRMNAFLFGELIFYSENAVLRDILMRKCR